MKSSPHSPQLEEARVQQRRPNTAKKIKNKKQNKLKKKKKELIAGGCPPAVPFNWATSPGLEI